MLLPKRVKYRRVQRGRMTGKATRGNVVCQASTALLLWSRHGSPPLRSRLPVLP